MTTALRTACIHQTTGDLHEIQREKTSFLRKTPSTQRTSIYAETMTMYYIVSTRDNRITVKRGNKTSLLERDARPKEEARSKTEIWTFTKRGIQRNHLIRKKERRQNKKQSQEKRKNIRTFISSLRQEGRIINNNHFNPYLPIA